MITRAVWEAKGLELFGPDMEKWRFVCPNCGKERSAESVRSDLAESLPVLRAGQYAVEQECIGRHLPAEGCNWAAYGLFRGPVIVDLGEGKSAAVFDFAGKPFTTAPAVAGGVA